MCPNPRQAGHSGQGHDPSQAEAQVDARSEVLHQEVLPGHGRPLPQVQFQ